MRLTPLHIHSQLRDYAVTFESSSDFLATLAQAPHTVFVVDEIVWQTHKQGALQAIVDHPAYFTIPISEDVKTLDGVSAVYNNLMKMAPKRNLHMVSIGGGITQDITGFVASTLYRGVAWTYVPTTLLAQADSCIGAKTSLNYGAYKNLLGTFYPPCAVHILPDFLATQQDEDFYSGLGEVAKLHLIGGQTMTENLNTALPAIQTRTLQPLLQAVYNSLALKQHYIESDEFDTGKRNLLNYGHCFGHAIEAATHFAIPHGQAVVVGMLMANAVACKRGTLSAPLEAMIRTSLLQPLLKTNVAALEFEPAACVEAMTHDKKNTGRGLSLVMLNNGYAMTKIDDMTNEEALNAFTHLRELIPCLVA
jgi:3-dehydroquinate synthase